MPSSPEEENVIEGLRAPDDPWTLQTDLLRYIFLFNRYVSLSLTVAFPSWGRIGEAHRPLRAHSRFRALLYPPIATIVTITAHTAHRDLCTGDRPEWIRNQADSRGALRSLITISARE
ncbi:hypothetical protein DTO271G3_4046 [Paecilomyces variotii]|nr:hypothetical protein DTO271G3_4046 [Paecilomyces variotii]